jgi:flagellar protein FliS
MYNRQNSISAYGKIANTETNPLLQIVMLYDGAIKFLQLAAADIEAEDIQAKAEHSNRALDIINYLQSILDFNRGGEVAPRLDNLYRTVTVIILRASFKLDADLMRLAAELLIPVRDAWETNAKANHSQTTDISAPNSEANLNIRQVA